MIYIRLIIDLIALPFRALWMTAQALYWRWKVERAFDAIIPNVIAHNETTREIDRVLAELEQSE